VVFFRLAHIILSLTAGTLAAPTSATMGAGFLPQIKPFQIMQLECKIYLPFNTVKGRSPQPLSFL
jgi:hypothetical protein